jgi:peptidoglycan biosynthesis protein MviN/MurJ (putative lipid II flippase)
MKMAVFSDVAPCILVHIDQRFREAYCLIALMMEAVSTSHTSSIASRLHGAAFQKTAVFKVRFAAKFKELPQHLFGATE